MLIMRLLLIEDNERLGQLIRDGLTKDGLTVDWQQTLEDGEATLEAAAFNLVLLDLGLPDGDGLDLIRRLRRASDTVPILVLTARGGLSDRITGLDAGADDYLVKPFEPKELLLRINAILRRVPVAKPMEPVRQVIHLGAVRYDLDRGEMWRGEAPVRLTATEAQLMRVFAAAPGVAISREKLVADQGSVDAAQERAVDVQITRLRRKIEDDPKAPRYLQTVRGEGYMLQPD